jgi:hypothetical protein
MAVEALFRSNTGSDCESHREGQRNDANDDSGSDIRKPVIPAKQPSALGFDECDHELLKDDLKCKLDYIPSRKSCCMIGMQTQPRNSSACQAAVQPHSFIIQHHLAGPLAFWLLWNLQYLLSRLNVLWG